MCQYGAPQQSSGMGSLDRGARKYHHYYPLLSALTGNLTDYYPRQAGHGESSAGLPCTSAAWRNQHAIHARAGGARSDATCYHRANSCHAVQQPDATKARPAATQLGCRAVGGGGGGGGGVCVCACAKPQPSPTLFICPVRSCSFACSELLPFTSACGLPFSFFLVWVLCASVRDVWWLVDPSGAWIADSRL